MDTSHFCHSSSCWYCVIMEMWTIFFCVLFLSGELFIHLFIHSNGKYGKFLATYVLKIKIIILHISRVNT